MARSRKKRAKKTTARNTPARRPSSTTISARESVEQRLTREILSIDRTNKARLAHDVVAIGERLAQLQERLGFGQWLSWLSRHLPFPPRTAQRYIAIAMWAGEHAEDFEQFAPLGLGKLQLLAALPPQRRARFRRQQRFQVPGTGTRKSLELMTLQQLDAVIRGMESLTASAPSVSPAAMLRRFRHRVAGLDALADQLRDNADALPVDDVAATIHDLESVLEELRSVLQR